MQFYVATGTYLEMIVSLTKKIYVDQKESEL